MSLAPFDGYLTFRLTIWPVCRASALFYITVKCFGTELAVKRTSILDVAGVAGLPVVVEQVKATGRKKGKNDRTNEPCSSCHMMVMTRIIIIFSALMRMARHEKVDGTSVGVCAGRALHVLALAMYRKTSLR